MTIKFKYGNKSNSYETSFGILEAELLDSHKKLTLEEFAKLLKQQAKIINGEIELHTIGFTFVRNKRDKE